MRRSIVCCALLLAFYSAALATTMKWVTVGKGPDFIAVNPTTNLIYSANAGDGSVSVIDGTTNIVVATITTGGQPQGIVVNPVTNRINVALFAGLQSTVSVIDGGSNTVVASIPVPGAIFLAMDSLRNRVYASDSDNTVRVIDGGSNTVIATIPFTSVLESIAVDIARNVIYVDVLSNPPTVAVISGSTDAVVSTISLPGSRLAAGLAVDSYLNQIYASDKQTGVLYVISGATDTVTNTITLTGTGNPKFVTIGANHQVLVSDSANSKVLFINGSTQKLTKSLFVKAGPWGVAVNPATKIMYVGLSLARTVEVIAP